VAKGLDLGVITGDGPVMERPGQCEVLGRAALEPLEVLLTPYEAPVAQLRWGGDGLGDVDDEVAPERVDIPLGRAMADGGAAGA
jgi:hypothetical protein